MFDYKYWNGQPIHYDKRAFLNFLECFMTQLCLQDPFGTVKVCAYLNKTLEQLGYSISISSVPEELNEAKLVARQEQLTPYFDPTVCSFSPERFFWMKLISATGKITGLQAYRYDYVDTSLAEWGPSYIIGLYMRRMELLVPTHSDPPRNSISRRLRGKLVYHGEFWVDPQARNRKILELFSRLGMILSLIKWNPDAIWALCSKTMAAHGHPNRMGYTYLEGGFLRWKWTSEEDYHVEWLNVAERLAIEQMINEMGAGMEETVKLA
jgi:hypothetical protein